MCCLRGKGVGGVAGTAPHQVWSPKQTHTPDCVCFGCTYPRNVLFEGVGWGGRHSAFPPSLVAVLNIAAVSLGAPVAQYFVISAL